MFNGNPTFSHASIGGGAPLGWERNDYTTIYAAGGIISESFVNNSENTATIEGQMYLNVTQVHR